MIAKREIVIQIRLCALATLRRVTLDHEAGPRQARLERDALAEPETVTHEYHTVVSK